MANGDGMWCFSLPLSSLLVTFVYYYKWSLLMVIANCFLPTDWELLVKVTYSVRRHVVFVEALDELRNMSFLLFEVKINLLSRQINVLLSRRFKEVSQKTLQSMHPNWISLLQILLFFNASDVYKFKKAINLN